MATSILSVYNIALSNWKLEKKSESGLCIEFLFSNQAQGFGIRDMSPSNNGLVLGYIYRIYIYS